MRSRELKVIVTFHRKKALKELLQGQQSRKGKKAELIASVLEVQIWNIELF
jgi:hypothetical protein